MKQIGYVAPNSEMVEIAVTIFKQYGDDVAIEVSGSDLGIQSARLLIQQGAKVIISRGGAALSISNNLQIPVVEIPITFEDIADAILRASGLGGSIAVIGFENLLNGLAVLNPLLKIDIEQVYIHDQREIREKIVQLKQKGIDVIIGGKLQCQVAAEYNMKFVLLQSGPKAICQAYLEAKNLLDTLLKERQRAEEVRAILDHTRDGYVAIDKQGKITLANRAVLQWLPYHNGYLKKSVQDVFPGLENLTDVLLTGKEYLHDITALGSTNVLYNRIPIILDKEVVGAVATLQNISSIQEAESKIRNNFFAKGWYASYSLADIKGESPLIKTTIDCAKKFSATDSTLLITGESGVGKEMFAQGIHNASNRKNGPFVGVNCASLPEGILESELFGYNEGAFTGARKTGKPGLFELAHHGTIFLDEISEIPLVLQGRLLRVLQEKKVIRLGSSKVIPVDIRIIAASNRDLALLAAQNKFRKDLFFRLNVLRLNIPPLRERPEDIPALALGFLEKNFIDNKPALSQSAADALRNYSWPGNIRELQNLMERLSITLSPVTTIDAGDIKNLLKENEPLTPNRHPPVNEQKTTISREQIIETLTLAGGSKEKAAAMLGVHRSTLWRWQKKYML
ncbi:sigma 54-interacting transcriptional regulator [Sporomusa acidovorans]|uniref:Anaerobic nitric oxide reductase transcription regulator NorR n=1 Tax=Sporomusa acidovorans (strain ATCC 49682 / DSM 3132 / Mol) TaxID=1123286 RepID=A0ABZ3IVY1_SPOA4|nr:sigma 54-interacting transcriptional regulator [Sporomusa acidovorans]OZC13975.1 arginine utilization regulatory protein RocR [Sporomusa acidovorans DSM 3132]SDF21569.1 Transcriptional regulator containing PAS, AAA-type ATPase, and DNA-binding Fis domains [Sporomusa acidovorans]